jgi:hypothetical protein
LKHRTEDRYIATAADLAVAPGSTSEAKFEEDIGVPFVSRFSHSNSVKLDETARHAGSQLPATLGAAGELFPGLRRLRHDNLPCSPQTTLVVVNSLKAHELVFGGPLIQFEAATKSASVVLILWRKGEKGRVLTAELSFRYEDANEDFRPDVAAAARRFFQAIQRADWARPEAMTKTQFMYGAAR